MIEKDLTPSETQLMLMLDNISKNYPHLVFDGLYLKVSEIKEAGREQTLRTIHEMFDPLIINSDGGKVFELLNKDIVILFPPAIKIQLERIVFKIKFFVSDSAPEDFATFYDFKTQYNLFVQVVKSSVGTPLKKELPPEPEPIIKQPPKPAPPPPSSAASSGPAISASGEKMLTPKLLMSINNALKNADFTSLIRRQPVCSLLDDTPDVLFEEVFVSIPDFSDTIVPDLNLALTPWLLNYLTETLDRKVLRLAAKHDDGALQKNFSLNLNLSTILSPDFLNFDENIAPENKSSIFIEISADDIFSDVASYIMAKSFIKACGYRICIDGITTQSLRYFNRKDTGADIIKLIWNSKIPLMSTDPKAPIFEDLARNDITKIVLSRVGNAASVAIGKSMGFNLFQGNYITDLMKSKEAPAVPNPTSAPASASAPTSAPAPAPSV